jgi:hypothetical protein
MKYSRLSSSYLDIDLPKAGEIPGFGLPPFPDNLQSFAERSAYQLGVAHGKVVERALKINLDLNVFDDDGNVVDHADTELSREQISDIVDHASQIVLLRREGKDFEAVLDELDEALSVSGVLAISCVGEPLITRPKVGAGETAEAAQEVLEQARLLGMSAERELALMAKLEACGRELALYKQIIAKQE